MQELTTFRPAAWAATYVLPTPIVPLWFWPLLALAGIACVLAAIWTRKPWLLLPGVALCLLDAFMERDITLGAAVILAGIGVLLVSGPRGI